VERTQAVVLGGAWLSVFVERILTFRHKSKKGTTMEIMTFIILIGVALIDGKLWKIMKAQRDHHRKVEALLSEIRDRAASK
jgi:hypothetical protein